MQELKLQLPVPIVMDKSQCQGKRLQIGLETM